MIKNKVFETSNKKLLFLRYTFDHMLAKIHKKINISSFSDHIIFHINFIYLFLVNYINNNRYLTIFFCKRLGLDCLIGKKDKMKLTNKQFLVDITLKSLQVKQTKQPSKISCEVHFGQNYLKMKIQPTVKNGVANFYEQRIRIPYASQMALVFKMLKNNKSQSFIGHYPLELQKALKQKQFFIEVKAQNLQETNAKVSFQCRILDKDLFQSQEDQLADDQMGVNFNKQFSVDERSARVKRQFKAMSTVAQSVHNQTVDGKPLVGLKKKIQFNILLNQQFYSELENVKDIISKKQAFNDRHTILTEYSRDEDGFLKTEKIQQLANKLISKREQQRASNFLIYTLISGVSFVIGFMFA